MNGEPDSLLHEARLDQIIAEFLQAEERDGPQDLDHWATQHPKFAAELREFFADWDRLQGFAEPEDQRPQGAPASPAVPPCSAKPEAWTAPLVPFAAQRKRFEVGGTLADQYRIFGIKAGGMGRVYLTEVIPLRRGDIPGKVAVKTIPDFDEWEERQRASHATCDRAGYEHLAARFRQEAETWVSLGKQHNVIWAFFVMDLGGKPYIFMEYAEEGDLRAWIAEQRLTLPLAVNLMVQFCRGMTQAVEACGLVHRDIKPANVLITKGYLLRITDFGLSKAFDAPESSARGLTDSSSFLSQAAGGTLAYMAPEQFLGLSKSDTRSDIYSFGVMAFEMVTGRRLFEAGSAKEHLFQRSRPVPLLHELKPDVPASLCPILARCLAFDAGARYQSFRELEAALVAVYDSLPERLPFPEGEREPPPDWLRQTEESSLLSLGRFERAAQRAEEGARLFPRSAGHWINRSVALMNLGRTGEARRCLEQATRLEPANGLAWANFGWAAMEEGDLSAGLQAALSATRLQPDLAEGWWTLGECQRRLGQVGEAIPSLQRSVQSRPHEWRAHHFLGSCLLEAGQCAEAVSELRETVHLHPHHAESWRLLAVVFGKLGRHGEARQAIDRALELDPQNSDAWAVRAIVLWHGQGASPDVRTCLKQALSLNPANSRCHQLLQMMGIQNLGGGD